MTTSEAAERRRKARERKREGVCERGSEREREREMDVERRERESFEKNQACLINGKAQDLELLGSLSLVELVSCTGIASVQDLQPPRTSWKEPCQEGCPFVPCFTNPSLACETSVTSFRF